MKLPETDPAAFAAFARFILTGWLFMRAEDEDNTGSPNKACPSPTEVLRTDARLFARLQELANFLQAPDFQDAITDALIETMSDMRRIQGHQMVGFSGSSVTSLYNKSTSNSPFRRLVVDMCVYNWDDESAMKNRSFETYPHRFCHDFIMATAGYITSTRSTKDGLDPMDISKSCRYHEHTRHRNPCYKEKFQYFTKTKSANVTAGLLTRHGEQELRHMIDSPQLKIPVRKTLVGRRARLENLSCEMESAYECGQERIRWHMGTNVEEVRR